MRVAFKIGACVLVVALCFVHLRLWSQNPIHPHPATLSEQLATEDRLRKPGWWPTKGSFSRNDFVGDAACSGCHADIVAIQKSTAMAQTSSRAFNSQLLAEHPLNYKLGDYTYQMKRDGKFAEYSLINGTSSFQTALQWAFGIRMGQSYLFEKNGGIFMAPLTYYPEAGIWDFTVDQPHAIPDSLDKAVGRHLLDDEVRGCFNCHNTAATVSDHFDPQHSTPGLTCEACHGPAADHVAAARAGVAEQGTTMILNPRQLNPVDSVDFCGSCHRTWWDVTLTRATGLKSLRFAPYRLENSRCWGKGDARLTCIACHDPHRPLERTASAYDQRCLSCHVNSIGAKPTADHPGAACPTARRNCVSCHMPKYQVIDIPVKFTDHQIRVVRQNEPMPE
ncbi:MAG: multiheme c-type cytochrome [Terriglobales bacterium]